MRFSCKASMFYFAPAMNRYFALALLGLLVLLPGILRAESLAVPLLIEGNTWTMEDSSIQSVHIGTQVFERTETGLRIPLDFSGKASLRVHRSAGIERMEIRVMPAWLALLPPLVAIVLALVFREVVTALLIGILSGTLLMGWFGGGWSGIGPAFLEVVEVHVLRAIVPDPVEGSVSRGHISVILFSVMIGGMVGLISKNGGMSALVKRVSVFAQNARSGMFATWLMGVLIFFDDYANTLIVGNTMRPVTDRLRISREKLAYLVDSTAAPVAAIAFITTWIGAELGYISDGLDQIPELSGSVYAFFFNSLRYSFYPLLTLVFMLFLIWKKKDFGPMLKAEREARKYGISEGLSSAESAEFEEVPTEKEYIHNALIPILIIVFGTFAGLLVTGWDAAVWNGDQGLIQKLSTIIGNSDSYKALIWSSFLGLVAAVGLTVVGRIYSLRQSVELAIEGFKSMVPAIMILVLAWALAGITETLQAAQYMSSVLQGNVSPYLLPLLTFSLSALISFSTGTSWGTMAILYPVMLSTSWSLGMAAGLGQAENLEIFYNVISCVLAGSVLGDHCSPISDTTILSSLASRCDHLSHVRTQMPYALTVGSVAVVFGTLLVHVLPVWLCFVMAVFTLCFLVSFLGKMPEDAESGDASPPIFVQH